MNKKINTMRHRWLYLPLFVAFVSTTHLYGMQPDKPASSGWFSWNTVKTIGSAVKNIFWEWDLSKLAVQNTMLLRSKSSPGALPGRDVLRIVDTAGRDLGQIDDHGSADGAPGTMVNDTAPVPLISDSNPQGNAAAPAGTGPSLWQKTKNVVGTLVAAPYNTAVAVKNLAEVTQQIKEGNFVDKAQQTVTNAGEAVADFKKIGEQLGGSSINDVVEPVPPLERVNDGDVTVPVAGPPLLGEPKKQVGLSEIVGKASETLGKLDESLAKLNQMTEAFKKTAETPAKSWFEGFYEGSIKPLADQYLTKRNMLIAGGVVVGTILTIAIIRSIANRIDRYYNRPRFNFTRIEYKDDWTQRDNDLLTLQNMIFVPEVKERLTTVLTTTASLKEQIIKEVSGAAYRNLFIYGPPGSGKRLFARQLADHAKMDFYELPGSALTKYKDGEAAAAVEDFFKTVAHQSRKGAVIYINNAALLFSDQNDGATHASAVISAMVEKLEKKSSAYMVVLGSSIKPNSYGDIRTGIDDIVEIKRPTEVERAKGLKLYRDKLLLGGSEVYVPFARSVLDYLSDEKIDQVARSLENATIGDIYDYIRTIRDEVQSHSEGLSEELVDRVTARAIEKYQALLA